MDSRQKISQSLPVSPHYLVRGTFDPLLAEHVRALSECPRPLAVQVVDPEQPLLPLNARQLLVAALACVDLVVAADAGTGSVDLDWSAEHERIRAAFIRHVHDKSSATQ
jgi:hypothetical protein